MEDILVGTSISPAVQTVLAYILAISMVLLIIGFNTYVLARLYFKLRNLIINDGKVDKGDRNAK